MPAYTDLVHAPPERVWQTLLDVEARTRWPKLASSATREAGSPGSIGAVVQYRRGNETWREVLLEAEPSRRLVYEIQNGNGQSRGKLHWRLRPVQWGTHLVLEVSAKGFTEKLKERFVRHRWNRRLLRSVKAASEEDANAPSPATSAPEPAPWAPTAKPARRTGTRKAGSKKK